MQATHQTVPYQLDDRWMSEKIAGNRFTVGQEFNALAFRHSSYSGLMDPLIMVDHFTMRGPTFGAHPHAGLAAVSLLLEESEGTFKSRDSLGNDIDLGAGDLFWLHAGGGAVHDEYPLPGATTQGLQMFVNLPAKFKHSKAQEFHIKAEEIPQIKTEDFRVRIVLGKSGNVSGAQTPATPMTLLDGYIKSGSFHHESSRQSNSWIYCISGELSVEAQGCVHILKAGESIALNSSNDERSITLKRVSLDDPSQTHFVLVEGQPLNESFVQQGPFVMSTQAELAECQKKYARGEFGNT